MLLLDFTQLFVHTIMFLFWYNIDDVLCSFQGHKFAAESSFYNKGRFV